MFEWESRLGGGNGLRRVGPPDRLIGLDDGFGDLLLDF